MRTLIVEDEEFLAEALKSGLRHEAIAADIALDGDDALDLVEVNQYDIVMLDRARGRTAMRSAGSSPGITHTFGSSC